jgi:hypothetical protein
MIADGGFTMVGNGPTQRWHGGISARFGLSACILVPPLLMAAGMAFFDSLPPQSDRSQPATQEAAAPQSIVVKTVSAADAGSSFALANTEMHPVTTGKRWVAPAVTEPITEQPATGVRAADPTDPASYYGPVPVTVVHIRKAGAPAEIADLGAPTPIATTAKISRRLPVATRSHVTRNHVPAHAKGRIGHHASHVSHPAKQQQQQHSHALNHPGQRPSIRRHTQRR